MKIVRALNDLNQIFAEAAGISFIHETDKDDFAFYVSREAPYLRMHFEFEDTGASIEKGSHGLFYFPVLPGKLVYPTIKNGFGVQIEMSLSFLNRAFHNDLAILGNFAVDVKSESTLLAVDKRFPLTTAMKKILMELYDCPYVGQLKKLFIEGKLLELLCLQIFQLTSIDQYDVKLRPAELNQVSRVRDIIQNNLEKPYSIEALATMVGMNRTKLQESFKSAYGNTIFGYLSDTRMELAKNLLLNEAYIKISEIARKTGYKNPNHFSAAFKRKFGTIPRLYKRQ